MNESDGSRKKISADYANALKSFPKYCCAGQVPKGVAAGSAGYHSSELASLPPDAVVNSFGCGNPVAFSAVEPGQVVLDLGSGAGIDLLLAAAKVGSTGRVIGVDMTEEMLDKARENVASAGLTNVELRRGIIEQLPVESGSVDWVISNCAINLSPEKHRVFAEIARVLRPGGTMLVSDITAEDLPEAISSNRNLRSACIAGAISEQAYIDGLRQAGLAEIEVLERLVYDASQIEMFFGPSGTCCGASINPAQARQWAAQLAGRVASIKVRARKRT
ncbi:MAG: methyltransferase domain-containing protein [Deltaproteobacteria bacterium]|nr:methyltransferase domain-containing protein [Deltaproteobacteria bacterium]